MELLFQRPKVRNSLGKNIKSTFFSKFNQHLQQSILKANTATSTALLCMFYSLP